MKGSPSSWTLFFAFLGLPPGPYQGNPNRSPACGVQSNSYSNDTCHTRPQTADIVHQQIWNSFRAQMTAVHLLLLLKKSHNSIRYRDMCGYWKIFCWCHSPVPTVVLQSCAWSRANTDWQGRRMSYHYRKRFKVHLGSVLSSTHCFTSSTHKVTSPSSPTTTTHRLNLSSRG